MISTGHRSRSLVLSPATVLHFRRDALVVSNRGLCCNYFRPVVERFRESVITTKNDQILFLFSFFPSLFFDAFSLLDRERKWKKERSAMIKFHLSFCEWECLSILIILVANISYHRFWNIYWQGRLQSYLLTLRFSIRYSTFFIISKIDERKKSICFNRKEAEVESNLLRITIILNSLV